MWHLFKHETGKHKGKYHVAFVVKGKYKVGSNQRYNKKADAIKCTFTQNPWNEIQEFIDGKNVVNFYYYDRDKLIKKSGTSKPQKRYIPNSK